MTKRVDAALASDVAERLRDTGRRWRIDGTLSSPSNEQVQEALDSMVEALYTTGNTQVEMGGILVKRDPTDHLDIYIHTGEII